MINYLMEQLSSKKFSEDYGVQKPFTFLKNAGSRILYQEIKNATESIVLKHYHTLIELNLISDNGYNAISFTRFIDSLYTDIEVFFNLIDLKVTMPSFDIRNVEFLVSMYCKEMTDKIRDYFDLNILYNNLNILYNTFDTEEIHNLYLLSRDDMLDAKCIIFTDRIMGSIREVSLIVKGQTELNNLYTLAKEKLPSDPEPDIGNRL